jgi:hypothetical protein
MTGSSPHLSVTGLHVGYGCQVQSISRQELFRGITSHLSLRSMIYWTVSGNTRARGRQRKRSKSKTSFDNFAPTKPDVSR